MAVLTIRARHNRKLRNLFARTFLSAVTALGGCWSSSAFAQAPESQWQMTQTNVSVDSRTKRQSMRMVVNTSREVTASEAFEQVRIANPNVLTTRPIASNKLLINALATGVTQIDLVGADNSVHTIEVMVLGDVRELEAILHQLFPDAQLQVVPIQGGAVLSGTVNSPEHVDKVIQVTEQYFPTVIDRLHVTGVYTIQLETQIMEVSRTKLRDLGIDWAFTNGDDFIAQSVGGLIAGGAGAFQTTGQETLQIGIINDSSQFLASIRALHRNNLVKVLASPVLTAVDGRPASFNEGGEIPVIVPAGLGQVAIQYREFGTRLDYVAKVRGNGKIYLEVRPYVSEIDPSRSVTIDGISVPGLRSRYLETGVELGAGQTLALGGLLQLRTETIQSGLPGLSRMPYLGALFRSTQETQNEVELLVTVTPNFAGPMDPHEVPCVGPGLSTQSPTDKELYFRGYMESPLANCEDCEQGIDGYPGMIESPGGSVPTETVPGNYSPSATDGLPPPMPTPNPAAMSVGPNAPKLARQAAPMLPPPNPGGMTGGSPTAGETQTNSPYYNPGLPTPPVIR